MTECNIKKRCETENQIELIIRRRIVKPNLFCVRKKEDRWMELTKDELIWIEKKNMLKRNFDKISLCNMKIEMKNKNYWISIVYREPGVASKDRWISSLFSKKFLFNSIELVLCFLICYSCDTQILLSFVIYLQ